MDIISCARHYYLRLISTDRGVYPTHTVDPSYHVNCREKVHDATRQLLVFRTRANDSHASHWKESPLIPRANVGKHCTARLPNSKADGDLDHNVLAVQADKDVTGKRELPTAGSFQMSGSKHKGIALSLSDSHVTLISNKEKANQGSVDVSHTLGPPTHKTKLWGKSHNTGCFYQGTNTSNTSQVSPREPEEAKGGGNTVAGCGGRLLP